MHLSIIKMFNIMKVHRTILDKTSIATKRLKKSTSLFQTARNCNKEDLSNSAALKNAKPFEEMPSMFMLPWLGTAWIYFPIIGLYNVQDPFKAFVDKRRRLGDIFREKIGSVNLVFSSNADDIEVMLKNEGRYPAREEFEYLKVYRESRKDWYTTIGLLVLQGKEWQDLRSKTQKLFLKPSAIQAYLNPMQDVAREFIVKIVDERDSNNEVPNFLGELYKWALESVALIGLDTRLGCLDKNLADDSDGMKMIKSVHTQLHCMNNLEEINGNIPFWKYFPTPTWKRFTKEADIFTETAFRYINRSLEELKKNAGNEDKEMTLLQSLLMTKGLDVSGVMVTVADLLMSGIDTTSHVVGFFLYNMARNPEKQELVYEEIRNLLPRKEDRITTQVLNELKYLKACIKESQRLFPIAVLKTRTADHDVVFSGYRVPAGTSVVIALQSVYTDERYFTNPNQYLPERWMSKDEKFHPFAFFPFGVGTRSCIGRRLAEQEIIILITEIIRNFKVTYHHEDIGIVMKIVGAPDKPLRFNFMER